MIDLQQEAESSRLPDLAHRHEHPDGRPRLPERRGVPMTRRALVVVDVQAGFDQAVYWGRRNNPACEAHVAALIEHWRSVAEPVVFVRHDSTEDGSPLRPGEPGNALKPEITGPPDLLVAKSAHSAFHGSPNLHAWLSAQGVTDVVVCGIATNHCCETTARVAADLGYRVTFVLDATHTFDRVAPDGAVVTADELARITATNLEGEFATVATTKELVREPAVA